MRVTLRNDTLLFEAADDEVLRDVVRRVRQVIDRVRRGEEIAESEVEALLDGRVTIPMAGRAESLNVAVAGSVLLFEAARQRTEGER